MEKLRIAVDKNVYENSEVAQTNIDTLQGNIDLFLQERRSVTEAIRTGLADIAIVENLEMYERFAKPNPGLESIGRKCPMEDGEAQIVSAEDVALIQNSARNPLIYDEGSPKQILARTGVKSNLVLALRKEEGDSVLREKEARRTMRVLTPSPAVVRADLLLEDELRFCEAYDKSEICIWYPAEERTWQASRVEGGALKIERQAGYYKFDPGYISSSRDITKTTYSLGNYDGKSAKDNIQVCIGYLDPKSPFPYSKWKTEEYEKLSGTGNLGISECGLWISPRLKSELEKDSGVREVVDEIIRKFSPSN